MTRLDETLGNSPARTFDSVKAGLIRARRLYDKDDEERQASSFHSNQLDSARIQLIDSLLTWIQPAVDEEQRAREAWEDRTDVEAKEPRLALDQPRRWTP